MHNCRPLSPQRRPGIYFICFASASLTNRIYFYFQFLAVSRVLHHGADRILLHPIAVDHVREVDLYNPGGLGLEITLERLALTQARTLPIVKGPRMLDPEVDHKYILKLGLITPKLNPGHPAQSPSKSKQATLF
jgi:hypothetical protein